MAEIGWEDTLIHNIKRNINWILEQNYENNQTLMAKDLDIKINTLHTYINSITKPPITFLYKLCEKSGITLDSLTKEDFYIQNEKMRKKEAVKQLYNRYKGQYYAYFFVVDSNSLKEGLIQEASMKVNETGNVSFHILNSEKQFLGNLIMGEELVYFDLKSSKEKINIIIKNPGRNIKESYTGGMGIVNISSPEDNRIPTAQKIIISSVRIPIERYFSTLKDFLKISNYVKIRKKFLSEILNNKIVIDEEKYENLRHIIENHKISDEDRITLGEREMNLLYRILDKDEFLAFKAYLDHMEHEGGVVALGAVKVNLDEDNMVYRFIKNEFKHLDYKQT